MKVENPGAEDLFYTGTVARILKLFKMPDGTTTTILQGRQRFALDGISQEEPFLEGRITVLEYIPPSDQMKFDSVFEWIHLEINLYL